MASVEGSWIEIKSGEARQLSIELINKGEELVLVCLEMGHVMAQDNLMALKKSQPEKNGPGRAEHSI